MGKQNCHSGMGKQEQGSQGNSIIEALFVLNFYDLYQYFPKSYKKFKNNHVKKKLEGTSFEQRVRYFK